MQKQHHDTPACTPRPLPGIATLTCCLSEFSWYTTRCSEICGDVLALLRPISGSSDARPGADAGRALASQPSRYSSRHPSSGQLPRGFAPCFLVARTPAWLLSGSPGFRFLRGPLPGHPLSKANCNHVPLPSQSGPFLSCLSVHRVCASLVRMCLCMTLK